MIWLELEIRLYQSRSEKKPWPVGLFSLSGCGINCHHFWSCEHPGVIWHELNWQRSPFLSLTAFYLSTHVLSVLTCSASLCHRPWEGNCKACTALLSLPKLINKQKHKQGGIGATESHLKAEFLWMMSQILQANIFIPSLHHFL